MLSSLIRLKKAVAVQEVEEEERGMDMTYLQEAVVSSN